MSRDESPAQLAAEVVGDAAGMDGPMPAAILAFVQRYAPPATLTRVCYSIIFSEQSVREPDMPFTETAREMLGLSAHQIADKIESKLPR